MEIHVLRLFTMYPCDIVCENKNNIRVLKEKTCNNNTQAFSSIFHPALILKFESYMVPPRNTRGVLELNALRSSRGVVSTWLHVTLILKLQSMFTEFCQMVCDDFVLKRYCDEKDAYESINVSFKLLQYC